MVDVAEWPKWLNDILTRLDNASAEDGPSATRGPAKISPTLRKELRDNCIELHQLHQQRRALREALERISAWDPRDGEDPRHWARDALRS